jgi:glycosyltransferase involved in cell wall biosynthesis
MIVSIVRPPLAAFHPEAEGLALNGANLAFSVALRMFANAPEVEALEIFLPPRDMLPVERLKRCADRVLKPELRGKGRIRFHAIHNLPLAWADGEPRLLFCQDLGALSRDRYLRDRFAQGPMPISCDTHCLGHHAIWQSFRDLASQPPVPYDHAITSEAVAEGIRRSFEALGSAVPIDLTIRCRPMNIHEFRPATPDMQQIARRALQLPEKGTITMYLSRLTPNAKADLLPLIDAFAAVREEGDTLLIAGVENAKGYAKHIAAHAEMRGIAESVLIQTTVPPALRPLFFAAADLFVFPGDTIQEAMCLVVAEAMASGLPVVASDWDGVRDQIVEGETGYLVPTYAIDTLPELEDLFPASDFGTDFLFMAQSTYVDVDALADRLRRLLRDPELRRKMGAAARKHAEVSLSEERWWRETAPEWQAQLEMAAQEDPRDRDLRRIAAERTGMAMPYLKGFRHYATAPLTDDYRVALTPVGRRVLDREETLTFYDETLPMLEPKAIQALLEVFGRFGTYEVGAAVESVQRASGAPESRVRFGLALLLKRGVLRIIPKEG